MNKSILGGLLAGVFCFYSGAVVAAEMTLEGNWQIAEKEGDGAEYGCPADVEVKLEYSQNNKRRVQLISSEYNRPMQTWTDLGRSVREVRKDYEIADQKWNETATESEANLTIKHETQDGSGSYIKRVYLLSANMLVYSYATPTSNFLAILFGIAYHGNFECKYIRAGTQNLSGPEFGNGKLGGMDIYQ